MGKLREDGDTGEPGGGCEVIVEAETEAEAGISWRHGSDGVVGQYLASDVRQVVRR